MNVSSAGPPSTSACTRTRPDQSKGPTSLARLERSCPEERIPRVRANVVIVGAILGPAPGANLLELPKSGRNNRSTTR